MASHSQSKVCFFFDEVKFRFQHRTRLERFIEHIFQKEGRALDSLNYIFCSDAKILQINKKYLDHNYFTDIITFELSGKGSPVQAEAYISYERVKDNSNALRVDFQGELTRVIFHGALHLCGYKDKTKRQSAIIRAKEDEYLKLYELFA